MEGIEVYMKVGKERIKLEGEEWLNFLNLLKEDE